MRATRRDKYTPLLVAVPCVAVVIWAVFSRPQRAVPFENNGTSTGEPADGLWLGADLAQRDPSIPNVWAPVRITRVWSRSPARAAGLEAGDIILRVGGTPIYAPSDLDALLATSNNPQAVDIAIRRDGRDSFVRVGLQRRPEFTLHIGMILLVLTAVFVVLFFTFALTERLSWAVGRRSACCSASHWGSMTSKGLSRRSG